MKHGFLYSNDEAGHYPASWYAATANPLAPFPQQQGEETADVCIIGAGYTGLSAALHLAKLGYKVVVMEAHRVGWGASGRNGGQVGTGQNRDQHELERRHGKAVARALWDLSVEAVTLCKSLIAEHGIECDLKAGIIHADHRQRFAADTESYVDKLRKDYQHEDITYLNREQLRAEVNASGFYGGSLDLMAAHLHPLNYVLGLADAAKNAGAQIYEHSPVLTYASGQTITVTSKHGRIKAQQLIIACNGYLDGLNRQVDSRIMPINNFIVATEPLDDQQRRAIIKNHYAVADSRFVVSYFRFSDDNRLLFGGGENYSFRFPKDIQQFVRPNLLSVFPQLCDTRLDYGWGGTLAITVKRMPYLARLAPNVLSASGYSGHGVAMATLSGKLMAEVIHGNASRFDILSKLPAWPFPGGTLLRWPLLALAMTWYSLRDRL